MTTAALERERWLVADQRLMLCHRCQASVLVSRSQICPTCSFPVDVRAPQFEVFDHRVQAAFKEAGETMPEQVRLALAQGKVDWQWYTAQLFALDISTKTRRGLLLAFEHVTSNGDDDISLSEVQRRTIEGFLSMAPTTTTTTTTTRRAVPGGLVALPENPEPAKVHEPAVATGDSELQATTAEEFLDLLRLLQKRSGLSFAKLADRAGADLSKSQAHAMVKEGRTRLPVRADQVRLFATACGLNAQQADRVVRLWAELRDGGGRSTVARRQEVLLATLTELQPDFLCSTRSADGTIEQVRVAQAKAAPLTPVQLDVMLGRLARTAPLWESSNAGVIAAGALLAALLGKEAVTRYKNWKRPCTCAATSSGSSAAERDSIAC